VPNRCDNRLAISDPPASVMELVRVVQSEDSALDFDTVVRMPAQPRGGAGKRPGRLGRREHWGVKCNTCDVTRRGYGRTGRVRYRFSTPSGPPSAFPDAPAARLPELDTLLTFEVEYLGDGAGLWCDGRRAFLLDEARL
jgi:hypothetical protein